MKEFFDEDRMTSMEFYEVQDSITEDNIASIIDELKMLIKKDPFYFDPYLLIADLYENTSKNDESEKIIKEAYDKALELIVDKSGQWPEKLEWGWVENRHIIRTLLKMGVIYWKKNESSEAYSLFEKIFKTNFNDNPGIRFFMLAILEKMSEKEFDKRFDKGGYWDNDIDDWFSETVNRHKNEFGEWLELYG